jgi:hypothetical protein
MFAVLCLAGTLSHRDDKSVRVILQSYTVDPIGFVRRFGAFQSASTQSKVTDLSDDRKIFNNSRPLHFMSPHWYLFIGNQYHLLPQTRSLYDYSAKLMFSPVSLYLTHIPTLVVCHYACTLTNLFRDDTLTITAVSSFSKDVYVEEIKATTLYPNDDFRFAIYICPTEAGSFTTVLLISTSCGTVPYSISYTAFDYSEPHHSSLVFYQTRSHYQKLTLNFPTFDENATVTALYDSELMSLLSDGPNSIAFSLLGTRGFYITFLAAMTRDDIRTLPLFFFVSAKVLHPLLPVLIVPLLLLGELTSEAEIMVVNPTNKTVTVISVHLSGNPPSNLELALLKIPIEVPKNSTQSLGKVLVHGTKFGPITATVLVGFEGDDLPEQTIEFLVKGCVASGSLVPRVKSIEMYGSRWSFAQFDLENSNSWCAVIGVRSPNPAFTFPSFVPFVVPPSQISKPIELKCVTRDRVDDFVFVETNVTQVAIPVTCFSGRLLIARQPDLADASSTGFALHIGPMFLNSTYTLEFWLDNPNPIAFRADPRRCRFSSGISNGSAIDFEVPKQATEKVVLGVHFDAAESSEARESQIQIACDGVADVFVISLTWVPILGAIDVYSDLKPTLRLGSKYDAVLLFRATYRTDMRIKQVWIPTGFSLDVNVPIPYDVSRMLCYATIVVGQAFLERYPMIDPVKLQSTRIADHRGLWPAFGVSLPFSLEVFLRFENGGVVRCAMPMQFTFSNLTLPNEHQDFGAITANTTRYFVLQITNENTVPVMYYGHIETPFQELGSVMSTVPSVAREGETLSLKMAVHPSILGAFYVPVTIATNCSPPYFFEMRGEAVAPEFGFFDHGAPVQNITITNVSYQVVLAGVHIQNLGRAAIPVDGIFVRPPCSFVTLDYLCPSSIAPKAGCFIRMDISTHGFRRALEVFELVFRSVNTEKSVTFSVKANALVFQSLRIGHWIYVGLILWAVLANMVFDGYRHIVSSVACRWDFRKRARGLAYEIERLSKSQFSSVGIQANFAAKVAEGDWRGGKWIRTPVGAVPVSKDGVGFLAQFLRELN